MFHAFSSFVLPMCDVALSSGDENKAKTKPSPTSMNDTFSVSHGHCTARPAEGTWIRHKSQYAYDLQTESTTCMSVCPCMTCRRSVHLECVLHMLQLCDPYAVQLEVMMLWCYSEIVLHSLALTYIHSVEIILIMLPLPLYDE